MSFLDFFVLEEAWSKRLRDFVKRVQVSNAKTALKADEVAQRLQEIEADISFLALLQMGTLKLLTDKNILKDGELTPRLAAVDMLDGVEDGKVDLSAVRDLIGMPRRTASQSTKKSAAAPAPEKPSRSPRVALATPTKGSPSVRVSKGTKPAKSKRKK